jgi:DNA-binding response OmpR family regulator
MRLLLVEDNPRLRELLTESVHGAGWRLDSFGTADEGQEAVTTTAYDLLLIDLGLPDGDGLDLIRDIRRRAIKTPILVLTARGAIDERIAGLDAGADDYLVKPINHGEFPARRALLRRAPDKYCPFSQMTFLRCAQVIELERASSQKQSQILTEAVPNRQNSHRKRDGFLRLR